MRCRRVGGQQLRRDVTQSLNSSNSAFRGRRACGTWSGLRAELCAVCRCEVGAGGTGTETVCHKQKGKDTLTADERRDGAL